MFQYIPFIFNSYSLLDNSWSGNLHTENLVHFSDYVHTYAKHVFRLVGMTTARLRKWVNTAITHTEPSILHVTAAKNQTKICTDFSKRGLPLDESLPAKA